MELKQSRNIYKPGPFLISLYLEEAFEALHFRHQRQVHFVVGSLVAALLGVTLNVYQAKLKEDKSTESAQRHEIGDSKNVKLHFGLIHHASLGLSAICSTAFFDTILPLWAWIISIVNILGKFTSELK